MNFLIFGLIAYLLGSIPTAVWIGKAWFNIDVREHGSKNAGATNTFRVLGKKPGIIVLSVDIIKGFLAVFVPVLFLSNSEYLIEIKIMASIFAVIGHVFPIFAGFKGGKGVATSLGVIIGLHPLAALICVGVFLIVFLTSNYVSLGAIVASITFPLTIKFGFKEENIYLVIFSFILGAIVIFAHKKNIIRLINKEENKMNLFKK